MAAMKRIHIFKAGRRTTRTGTTIEFSEADVAACAAAYDPSKHEAPIVLGHPKTDGPAHGWAKSVTAVGADMYVDPRDVATEFAEGVKSGSFKKVSAAFYPPDHSANPVPGVYYLRHVGFLGAEPPAVKGLQPVEFSDDGENLVEIEFGEWTDGVVGRALRNLREWFIGKYGLEEADKAIPAWQPDALVEASLTPDRNNGLAFAEGASPAATETPDMTKEEIAAQKQAIADQRAAQEAEFSERDAKLKEREDKIAREDDVEFAEQLINEGRVPGALKNRVVELLFASRASDATLEFSEGDATVKAPARDTLVDFLKALPVSIEFAEVSPNTTGEPVDVTDANALAAKATEFVESEREAGRVISVAQAMHHVTKQAAR